MATGPNATRATDPLNGTASGLPAETNHGSVTVDSSETGAITET